MIIVTGGAGMIGSNIVKALNNKGYSDILVVDNLKDGTKFVNLVDLEITDYMDKEDFIDDSYILEVSSPGLGRPLKKEKDFARSIGKEVDIRLYRARDKQKDFTGILTEYDKDSVTIETEDETRLTFERADIALIRLAFDF